MDLKNDRFIAVNTLDNPKKFALYDSKLDKVITEQEMNCELDDKQDKIAGEALRISGIFKKKIKEITDLEKGVK